MKNESSDKLVYNLNRENFSIYLNNKFETSILKEIEYLKSDNKILFVYDSNIDEEIIANLIKFLKKTGNLILIKKLRGNKSNKNKNQLLKLSIT